MPMISLFLYCLLFSKRGCAKNNACHRTSDFCNRKTKAIYGAIPSFVFVLPQLLEVANRIREIILSFQDLEICSRGIPTNFSVQQRDSNQS